MIKYVWFFVAILSSFAFSTVNAQVCGSVIHAEDEAELRERSAVMRSFNARSPQGIRDFPVKAHIFSRNDGSGGISLADVKSAIEEVNTYFINANVRFVLMDEVNYVTNSRHFDFDIRNEDYIASLYDVEKVINLYLFNSIQEKGVQLCGYAHYPNKYSYMRNRDRILMRNSCTLNGSSLVHEFGHFFSLFHTHGNPKIYKQKELVTRHPDHQNCEEAGDGLCDTPADPGLFRKVNNNCEYIGNENDAMGVAYSPNPHNIMSYANNICRDELSEEQYNRINYIARKWRSYMKFPENSDQPVADNSTTIPEKPDYTKPTPKPTYSKLSGEIVLDICGQPIPTELERNLFRGVDPYYSGTTWELSVINDEQAYVYVFASDLTRQNYLLFPQPGQSAYLFSKNQAVSLPGNNELFILDETTGRDYLCILYSKKPIDIEYVLYRMEYKTGNFMQRLYKVLGRDLVRGDKVKYSDNGRIQFYANTTEQEIVPIIVEFEHL